MWLEKHVGEAFRICQETTGREYLLVCVEPQGLVVQVFHRRRTSQEHADAWNAKPHPPAKRGESWGDSRAESESLGEEQLIPWHCITYLALLPTTWRNEFV